MVEAGKKLPSAELINAGKKPESVDSDNHVGGGKNWMMRLDTKMRATLSIPSATEFLLSATSTHKASNHLNADVADVRSMHTKCVPITGPH